MPHSHCCRPRGRPAVAIASSGRRLRRLLPAATLLLAFACVDAPPSASPAAPITVPDDAGRRVTLAQPATRVVSLIPAQTEIIALLAGPSVLVARTHWDTSPSLRQLPSTENALAPSVEWLASLRPDLVIAWPDQSARNVIARLEAIGIPVYASAVESLADVDTMIARFGVLLGRSAAADSLRLGIHAELDAVRARVAGRERPSVLYAVSIDPPMPATNATYLGELVELAGGTNAFGELRTLWPQVSLEEVVRRDPAVIIRPVEDPTGDVLATLRRRAGWRDLRAVRDGRVYAVDVNLLNRPGARMGQAAEVLARAIHPDAFGPR